MFEELEAQSPEIRKAKSGELLRDQQESIQEIAALVEKYLPLDERRGTAKDNILLLGKLHAVECVPLLVDNLTFEVFYKNTKRPQTTEDLYPAVQALIDIGSHALNPVMERLKNEDDQILQRTGAAVLRGVLGSEWASVILEHEIETTKQNEVKERLQRILKRVQELP